MEQAQARARLEPALVPIPTRTSVPEFLPRPAPEAQATPPPVLPPFPASTFAAAAQRSSISPASDRTAALPASPARSPAIPNEGPAITIVATSRSGGAFDFYGKLPGDNYTVYVDTSIGTVVMQFAEVNPAAHSDAETLVGPRGYVTGLPPNLPHARVVIKCRLDTSGKLQNLQVLEPGPAMMTAKIMAALPHWKFRPAMRGTRPVEINAILGFNINTDDRY